MTTPLAPKPTQLLDDSTTLQEHVHHELQQVVEGIRRSYWSVPILWPVFKRVMLWGTVTLLIVLLFTRALLLPIELITPLQRVFGPRPTTIRLMIGGAAFTLWIILSTIPALLLARVRPRWKEAVWGLNAVVLIPLLVLITEYAIDRWLFLQDRDLALPQVVVLLVGFNVIALMIAAVVVLLQGFVSTSLFLALSHPLPRKAQIFIPAQPELQRRVVERTYHLTQPWSSAHATTVRQLLRDRAASVAGQLQTVTGIFGLSGFLGIFAVIYTQDEVQANLAWLAVQINTLYGGPVATGPGLVVAAALLLLAMIVFASRYILTFYSALRTLEIADVVCALRIEEATVDEQAQRQAAASTAQQQAAQEAQREVEAQERLVVALDRLHYQLQSAQTQPPHRRRWLLSGGHRQRRRP